MGSNSEPPPHHNPNGIINHHVAGDHPPSDEDTMDSDSDPRNPNDIINHQVADDQPPLDEDIQLQLTLGFTNNNEAQEVPYSIHQNDYNNHQNDDTNSHVEPKLQPFVFCPLLTYNDPILYSQYQFSPQVPLPPPPPHNFQSPPSSTNPPRRPQTRQLRSSGGSGSGSSSSNNLPKEKSKTIKPPYPWATHKRCQVQPSVTLKSQGHLSITGRVKCRKCERSYDMAFDLDSKFMKVGSYIIAKKEELCHRAPEVWMNPALPECAYCHQKNAVKPEIEGKKRNTNWLFLFLGQMLGCCTGEQLKYFCKHNGHHRTAAKDRLLYLAYLSICRQLDPDGPFNL